MPAHRKLPPTERVVALVEQGLTQRQIGEMFGVSPSAVGECLRVAKVSSPRRVTYYNDHIPWKVRVAHNSHVLVRRLRLHARKDTGGDLRPDQLALLDQWMTYMRHHDAVVVYEPDTEQGFFLDHRQPGDLRYVRPHPPRE